DAGNVFDDVDELIDRDELVAADVERLATVAGHQPVRALEAVVDVHEASRLLAVAPHIDVASARQLRRNHLPADRGWCLLASAVVGAERSIDVVIAGHAGLEA